MAIERSWLLKVGADLHSAKIRPECLWTRQKLKKRGGLKPGPAFQTDLLKLGEPAFFCNALIT
jgi:hypothetical protein